MKSRMRWVGHVAPMGENRNAYRILVGKPRDTNAKKNEQVGGQY
jgi:hypothetical protein